MKRETLKLKLSDIKLNDSNPRIIKVSQMKHLIKSIQDFPEMAELRPIVIDEDNVILGGNMRYRAMKQLGYEQVEVVKVSGLTDEQKREFIVKDNVPFGEWDWDALANGWDATELSEWGLEVPSAQRNSSPSSVNGIDLSEMQLRPFESYDYIVLLFRNRLDFQVACDKLEIEKGKELVGYGSEKVGIGRCVDGRKILE